MLRRWPCQLDGIDFWNGGPPIPTELLPTLYEPFIQGKRGRKSEGSVGLGLYIAQQIVAAHGGRIDVVSTEKDGTTFSVRLPRAAPPSAAESESESEDGG